MKVFSVRREKGFSLIELLIVVAIILIIAAIALPSLLRARVAANDSAAATTLRTINTAEVTYSTSYPTSGYAPNLQTLGPPTGGCATAGSATSTNACLIDNVLGCASAACTKGGYNYFVVSSGSAIPYGDYTASATPLGVGETGSRNWCSNPDAVVRMSAIGAAKLSNGETQSSCSDTSKYSATNFS